MKRMIPYLLSLVIGTFFGYILFQEPEFNIEEVFAKTLTVKAFQIGVFNNKEGAEEFQKKYLDSIIYEDDGVYRVFYSILTKDKVISRMEKYLKKENINYYIKIITITDSHLIQAIEEYEETMLNGSDNVLKSINKLIMSNYNGGKNVN
ncbi:MAG: hypothetical protein PHF21_01365 [Bacilli bacterium]|nr:hypothetical protein [Bacilli bacterium]